MAMEDFLPEFKILSKLKTAQYVKNTKYIVSIDEVGRGALAGPVVVGAVLWLLSSEDCQSFKLMFKVKDSKKLTKIRRQELFKEASKDIKNRLPSNKETFDALQKNKAFIDSVTLTPPKNFYTIPKDFFLQTDSLDRHSLKALHFSVQLSSQYEIDEINILNATCLAASRAIKELSLSFPLSHSNTVVLLDGNQVFRLEKVFQDYLQVLVTKGDSLLKTIGLSSILAKVFRDGIMEKLHEEDSRFHFDKNVGYGTKEHCLVLKNGQSSSFHRRSFLRNFLDSKESLF